MAEDEGLWYAFVKVAVNFISCGPTAQLGPELPLCWGF